MAGENTRRDRKAQPSGECEAARQALVDGDHKLARMLANAVLAGPASDAAKEEARAIVGATRVDPAGLAAGAIMLVVLAALFALVLMQRPL